MVITNTSVLGRQGGGHDIFFLLLRCSRMSEVTSRRCVHVGPLGCRGNGDLGSIPP